MSVFIRMDEGLRDIEIDRNDTDDLILIRHGDHTIYMTPEAARALAFVIVGMTDQERKKK